MILNFLVYSGIFTGLCAAALSCFYLQLLNHRIYWEVPVFIFLATSMSYSILQSPLHNTRRPNSPRTDWYNKYHQHLKPFIIVELIALTIMCFFFTWGELIFFAHLGLLVLAYDTIFAFIKFPLRQIPYLKSVIIAYVWAMATTFPAVSIAEASPIYIVECFVFIWCLTVVFDLRDISIDKAVGLRTIISLIGEQPIRFLLAIIFLADAFYTSHILFAGGWWVAIISTVFYIAGVFTVKDKVSDYFLVFGIDSLILLRLCYLL